MHIVCLIVYVNPVSPLSALLFVVPPVRSLSREDFPRRKLHDFGTFSFTIWNLEFLEILVKTNRHTYINKI